MTRLIWYTYICFKDCASSCRDRKFFHPFNKWNYKNLLWLWGADWKFHHEGNCSASRGLPSDAEQLPEWRNFQFAPKNYYGFFFLHTVPSTIAFRLEYVLFYQFYAKITTFFDQEKFGTAPLLYNDVETFGGNWRENGEKNDVKTAILTSCTRVILHPSCNLSVSQKSRSGMQEEFFLHIRPEFPWTRLGLENVILHAGL